MKKLLLLIMLTACITGYTQNQSNIWYFGQNAGLDFNTPIPEQLTDGAVNTFEGTSVYSNADGELQFYTDGITVYNKLHEQMSNGGGLMGDPSSTQSAVIVPKPCSSTIFYIFTIPQVGGKAGVRYSEVDMELDGGLGDVTGVKNILVTTPVYEKLTSVLKGDGSGYWVITHEFQSNDFLAFSITSEGVNTTPVISSSGSVISMQIASIGYLKASPDGTKLVCSNYGLNTELFDFDPMTGIVSNGLVLNTAPYAYGSEFSPSGNVVYITTGNTPVSDLIQYDLTASNIPDTGVILESLNGGYVGALQLASNGKIYGCRPETTEIYVINNPEVTGTGCNYTPNAITMPVIVQWGLPQNVLIMPTSGIEVSAENVCLGNPTPFSFSVCQSVTSILWDFGDGETSDELAPSHTYAAAGLYDVVVTAQIGDGSTEQTVQANVYDVPVANTVPDQTLCGTAGTNYDLTQNDDALWGSQTDDFFIRDYYGTLEEAQDHINPLATDHPLLDGVNTFYAGVYNPDNLRCYAVETFTVTLTGQLATGQPIDYVVCDDQASQDGIEMFDLTTKDSQVSTAVGITITYYENEDDAQTGENFITAPNNYFNITPNTQEIFARADNGLDCYGVSSFNIVVSPLPEINAAMEPFLSCEDAAGTGNFNLDAITPVLTDNTSGLTVSYYATELQAQAGGPNTLSSPYPSGNVTIYARIKTTLTGCTITAPVQLEVISAPVAGTPYPLEECDPDGDHFAAFDLNSVLEQIANDIGNVMVTIYETFDDAAYNENAIVDINSYNNIDPFTQMLYIRVEAITGNTECFDIVQLQLIVNPVPVAVTPEPYEMCDNGNDDTDGNAIFDLTTLEEEILGTMDPALFSVSFHPGADEAANDLAEIPTPASYLSETGSVWARVTNNDTGCYDVVEVSLIVNDLPVAIQPTPLTLCDDDIDDPEQEVFDLTTKIPEIILDQEGLDVTFHNSYEEADDNQNAIANPYEYVNNPPVETLFVRVTNAETGCYRIVLLDVRVAPLPIIEMPTEDDLTVCDTDGNGIGEFDLQALEEAMINNGADLSIAFYETAEDAVAGENPIPNTTTYHNIVPYNQTIYVIVSNSETGCTNSIPYELNLVVTPAPQAPALEDITDCDDQDNNGQNGMAFFDLTVQDQVILDALNAAPGELTIHYFIREDWANEGAPRITVPDHYMGSDEQTIWVRVEDPVSECYSITSFQLFLDLPLELTTPAPLAKCNEALPNDFQTVFNLREKDDEILGDLGIGQGYTVEYFESQAAVDANTPIANPEAYTNPVNPKTIFVVVTTDKGCRSYTTLTIRVLPLPVPDTTPDALELCDVNGNGDGIEVFDLTDAELDIRNNDFSAVVTYHVSLEDAENDANAIGTPDAYTSGNGFVWVRVEAATTNAADPVCYQVVQLELKIIALPPVGANGQITPYAICELSIDGIETFYLKDYIEGILGAGADTDYDIEFYFDQAALDNGTALPAIYENEVPFTQTIVVYVQHLETGCEITAPLTLIVRQQAVANTPDDIHYCDTDGTNDGLFTPIDLTQAEAGILDGQDDTLFDVTYYLTEQDATDDVNAIADPANFTNTEADLQVLWARVTNNQSQGQCFDVTSFSVVIERLPEPEIFTTPEGDNTVCIDFDGTIAKYLELHSGVTPNGHTYEWFRDGVAIADADPASGSYMAGEGGMYSVRVTSALGCISDISEEFEVIESGQASPIGAGYFVTNAFSDEQTITVLVQGNGVYEYQLDEDGLWQTSNIFVNVAPGSHTVTVRDVKTEFACAELVLDGVSVIDYPNFFTPNGDGFHDTWNLIGLADQTDAVVYIFDRYGKLIKQISTAGEGWDGTFNGQPAVSTDYWFTVTYREFNGTNEIRKEFKSHFSLKR